MKVAARFAALLYPTEQDLLGIGDLALMQLFTSQGQVGALVTHYTLSRAPTYPFEEDPPLPGAILQTSSPFFIRQSRMTTHTAPCTSVSPPIMLQSVRQVSIEILWASVVTTAWSKPL